MTTGSVKTLLIQVLLYSVFTVAPAQESAESDKTKLKAGFTFSLHSNGIAPIPYFSLGAPAIIAVPSITIGRFNYEPILAYDLDIQPWFLDNWFRYKIIDRPRFDFRTGVNFSMYFSDLKLPESTVLQGQRYLGADFSGTFRLTSKSYISGVYLIDRGQDAGTIKGHYFSIMGERSEIGIGKSLMLAANLHLFYIDYNGNNDGLFIAPKITTSLRNLPFAIFFHVIQTIESNISPYPGFNWNLGLAYSL